MCATSSIPVSKSDSARLSILCADASPDILEICETIFTADGYQVFTAASGAAALQFLGQHPVDAVIIDDTMTDMDGVDLASKIKTTSPELIVVMYCGSAAEDQGSPFIDSWLSKGKGPIALRTLVDSLLHRQARIARQPLP